MAARIRSTRAINGCWCINIFYFVFKSKNFFNAISIEIKSWEASLPNFFKTSVCSIVDMAGLIADGLNNPAPCQSAIKHSPIPIVFSVWLVIAIITMSEEILL